jgi:hypothetical protein
MNLVTTRKQHGITFANFLLMAILVVFVAIFGMKVIPAYVENRTIIHILETIAHAPEMQDALPSDIRIAFDKNAMMNNITEVSGQDIEIQKLPTGGMVLNLKYKVKIALVGNASLLLEFDSSSSRLR